MIPKRRARHGDEEPHLLNSLSAQPQHQGDGREQFYFYTLVSAVYRTNWHFLYLTHNNSLINLNCPYESKLSAQVVMYLEHLINNVLAITTTHLFTSSWFSFSKHVFLYGVWVEEGGSPEPLGGLPAAVSSALFMVPSRAAWTSLCPVALGLWVSSLLLPWRRWPVAC